MRFKISRLLGECPIRSIERINAARETLSISRSSNRHEPPSARRSPRISRSGGCKPVSSTVIHESADTAADYPHPRLFLVVFRHASGSMRLNAYRRDARDFQNRDLARVGALRRCVPTRMPVMFFFGDRISVVDFFSPLCLRIFVYFIYLS